MKAELNKRNFDFIASAKTMEYKLFHVSSYGVQFVVTVVASHFDDYLIGFINNGLEEGNGLFEYIADRQCESTLAGDFDAECFMDTEGQADRNLAKEYKIKASFKVIGFEEGCCDWLKVTEAVSPSAKKPIKALIKGEFFRLSDTDKAKVWVRGDYVPSERKYSTYQYDDINHERLFKGSREVFIGFTF
ncbi:hypothetical protein [Bacteroides fragilis]|nr:hypothetical protein [Bacteroides fragilis]